MLCIQTPQEESAVMSDGHGKVGIRWRRNVVVSASLFFVWLQIVNKTGQEMEEKIQALILKLKKD